jgi:hypothetical protein
MVVALDAAWRSLGQPERPVLVHGACGGADAMADALWKLWGWPTEPHPADFALLGRAAGPQRNTRMVDLGADLCLAFPLPGSRGTKDCVQRARAAGIPVRIYGPLAGSHQEQIAA